MDRAIVTMGDDTYQLSLECLLESIRRFNQDIPIFVIFFTGRSEATRQIMKRYNARLLRENVPAWREVGRSIWGVTPHRPGIKKMDYFRKLACSDAPADAFLFLDANYRVLCDVACFFDAFERSDFDILFQARSFHGKNFFTEEPLKLIEQINPNVRQGFNASAFVARKGVFDLTLAQALCGPGRKLRRILGRAPEQAFMNYYIGLMGIRCALFGSQDPALRHGVYAEKIERGADGAFYRAPGEWDSGKKLTLVQVRERALDEHDDKQWLFDEFRADPPIAHADSSTPASGQKQ